MIPESCASTILIILSLGKYMLKKLLLKSCKINTKLFPDMTFENVNWIGNNSNVYQLLICELKYDEYLSNLLYALFTLLVKSAFLSACYTNLNLASMKLK